MRRGAGLFADQTPGRRVGFLKWLKTQPPGAVAEQGRRQGEGMTELLAGGLVPTVHGQHAAPRDRDDGRSVTLSQHVCTEPSNWGMNTLQ